MRKAFLAALAFGLSLASSGAAGAAVLMATYSGTVASGSVDDARLFSDGQQSLAGERFTLSFIYDPAIGLHGEDDFDVHAYGGAQLDVLDDPPHVDSPISQVQFTLNGVTRTYGGNLYGSVSKMIEVYQLRHVYGAEGTIIHVRLLNPGGPLGRNLDDLVDLPGWGGGSFEQGLLIDGQYRITDLDLSPDHLGVRELGAVPEPATWAVMILGFAAVGGVLRRRRSIVA